MRCACATCRWATRGWTCACTATKGPWGPPSSDGRARSTSSCTAEGASDLLPGGLVLGLHGDQQLHLIADGRQVGIHAEIGTLERELRVGAAHRMLADRMRPAV